MPEPVPARFCPASLMRFPPGSTAVTRRPLAMRLRVSCPVPHPISSTGSPYPRPATSQARSTSASGYIGLVRSYSSATSSKTVP